MKSAICWIIGFGGALVTALWGGWTEGLMTLVILMGIDYCCGLIVAGVFHKSKKSDNGALSSIAGWKGIMRKFVTLLIVSVAYRIDVVVNTNYLRDAVTIAFSVNECISIIENAGLMGIPIPQKLRDAIEVLKDKQGLKSE